MKEMAHSVLPFAPYHFICKETCSCARICARFSAKL